MDKTRRGFLALVGMAPIAIAASASAKKAPAMPKAPACYDPAKLSLADRNNRRVVSFVEISNNPAKRCGLCAFYESTSGACGKCKLFAGKLGVTTRAIADGARESLATFKAPVPGGRSKAEVWANHPDFLKRMEAFATSAEATLLRIRWRDPNPPLSS